MKILELRFKNLNSLYGEWFMDFTHPEYVSNGIFVLTGPTGAGKSTILDAICLALYGATPRLGKITRGGGNEIMSRQTGECYAEVVFESQENRFRCHWEQRRARKQPGGKLQDHEHQISDADTGKPIETRKSLVGGVIEEKTGMDFDRFTRSILLAQGGFDTFLKADIEQKSKILEQITGTGIYSEISRRVHERQRDEKERLNLLATETAGIAILEPEEEEKIQETLGEKDKQEIALAQEASKLGAAITWLTSIDALKKEILALKEEGDRLQADMDTFKPHREKLERGIKAASLEGIFATLTAIRKQQAEDQAALKEHEMVLPQLQTSANTQAEHFKFAEGVLLKAKENLKIEAPLIQKVRSLDQRILEQGKAISEHFQACDRESKKIDGDKQAVTNVQKKQLAAEKERDMVVQYLMQNARDEWLISGLAGIEEQFANFIARQEEITEKERAVKHADKLLADVVKKLKAAAEQSAVWKHKLEDSQHQMKKDREVLQELLGDTLLREYRTEKETLLREMGFIRKITELEALRNQLEDGKQCPLCGAINHPFAQGNIPQPDEMEQRIDVLTRIITRAEDQEAAIKELEQDESAIRDNLNASEKLVLNAENEKVSAQKASTQAKEELVKVQADFSEYRKMLSNKIKTLGFSMDFTKDFTDPKAAISHLKLKMEKWQEQARKRTEIEQQIALMDGEIKRLHAVIETRGKVLAETEKQLAMLQENQARNLDERKMLYGDKNPDDEELRLGKAIEAAEKNERQIRKVYADIQEKLAAANAHMDSLKERIQKRLPELKNTEEDFLKDCSAAGFSDERFFLGARLPHEERETLAFRVKVLDDTQMDLRARQKDRKTRLNAEVERNLTDKTLEMLIPEHGKHEEALKTLREEKAALQHKLRENAAAKDRIRAKQAAISLQKKECLRWDKLHTLIGSADGKKYRNFAQGLTFELMVGHANQQLAKMSDRYLLVRDNHQPLELNVTDNYQAGEIRSTRNLSGGESFLVSLSLALGLSRMSSRNVRVDSLFLDEGFGTLDEDALETALETLSSLQQDGKIIGIISHVAALKDRITTQINVIPNSGGRSLLKGPGCISL